MDERQSEILQRFDESRNAYNTASGLLKKGKPDEAEELLRQALKLYPREFFMDESLDVDPTLRESFSLLFSNIRARIEQIERDKFAPKVDGPVMTSLQEIVERNMRAQMGGRHTPVIFGSAGETERPVATPPSVSAPIPMRGSAATVAPAAVPDIEDVIRFDDEPAAEARHGGRALQDEQVEEARTGDRAMQDEQVEEARTGDRAMQDEQVEEARHGGRALQDVAEDEAGLNEGAAVADGQLSEEPVPAPNRDRDEILEEIFGQSEKDSAAETVSEAKSRTEQEEPFHEDIDVEAVNLKIEDKVEPEARSGDRALHDAGDEEARSGDLAMHGDKEEISGEISEPAGYSEPVKPAPDVNLPRAVAGSYEARAAEAEAREMAAAEEARLEEARAGDLALQDARSEEARTGDGALNEEVVSSDELTEDIFKDKKPRGLRGLSMKLPGLLKRKAGKKKDKDAAPGEELLVAAADETTLAEPAPVVEERAPAEEVMEDAAPETAPDAAAEEKPGKVKRARRQKKAPGAAARKVPARRKGAVKRRKSGGGRAGAAVVKLLVLIMVCAGVFFAYLGLKPVMQLKMAYAAASNVEAPKDKKPNITDRAVNILWGVKAGDKALAAGSLSSVSYLGQLIGGDAGHGLAVATVAADAAALSGLKKADEAASLITAAAATDFGGPQVAEQQYINLYNASVRAYKDGNMDAALKYHAQLMSSLQDDGFPDPGMHYRCLIKSRALGQLIYLGAAKKKMDGGDARGAFDALVKLQPQRDSLSEARGKVYDDLAAQISGSLTGDGEKLLGADPKAARELAAKALTLAPDNADARSLAARAGKR